MWSQNDRPFRGVDKIVAASEFIFAADRLMVHDVRPELLPERDRATVEYYLECLSEKFSRSTRVVHSTLHIDDADERSRS
jgi:hypothetical protein